MKKILIAVITLLAFIQINAQVLINKEWEQTNGIPTVAFDYQTSVKDQSNNLIVIGNTYRPGQQENVYLVKYNSSGVLQWDLELNGLSDLVDFGLDLTTDAAGTIYCTGTMRDSLAAETKIFTAKVSASGILKWVKKYNANYLGYAAPSDIMLVGTKIFVSGTVQVGTIDFDAVILCYDTAGTNLWNARRNVANGYDGYIGLTYNYFSNRVTGYGFAGTSFTTWKYLSATYAASNGAAVSWDTSSASTVGISMPIDVIKDKKDNVYITGYIQKSANDFDIRVVKFDSAFSKKWEKDFDWNTKDDRPTAINFANANESAVFLSGYSTNSSNIKNAVILKLSAANGDTLLKLRSEGFESSLEKIIVNNQTSDVLTIGSKKINGVSHYLTQAFDTTGVLKWERTFLKGSASEGKDIVIDSTGKINVSGRTYDTAWHYTTIQYDSWKTPDGYYQDSFSNPLFMRKRILVKVNQDSVNLTLMNEKRKQFGSIANFLGQAVQDSFVSYFGTGMANSVVSKICQIRPADSISITRSGTEFNMKNVSTLLAINYPESIRTSEIDMSKIVAKKLFGKIIYAHPDYLGTLDSANDTHYGTSQLSLRPTPSYPQASINVHPAWNLLGDDSLSFIRVGIIDDGTDWSHPDLGGAPRVKVKEGFNYETGASIFNSNIGKGDHGTKVAGIIGAIRNNALGVAGIAGGTVGVSQPNKGGVSLYPVRVLNPFLLPVSKIYAAITDNLTYSPGNPDLGYGFNIINCSWGFSPNDAYYVDTNIYALQEAIYYANKNFVTVVASRGNNGANVHRFPATYGDSWVMSVGSSGAFGNKSTSLNTQGNSPTNSNYGRDMDFLAPGWFEMIRTTGTGGLYPNFSQTSAAAAHVSGVAALIKAYLDDPDFSIQNTMPDDIENIIELSAADRSNITGFDDSTGWGLVDAGAALQLVDKSTRYLKHVIFGQNPADQYGANFITGPFAATFTGPFQINSVWNKEGKYNVELYQLEASIRSSPNQINDVPLHFWNLGSYCDFLAPIDSAVINPAQSNSVEVNFDPLLNNFYVRGNYYKVFDTLNNFLGFYPYDLGNVGTIPAGVGVIYQVQGTAIKPVKTNNFYLNVHPVPASAINNIDVALAKPARVSVTMFDISGRQISEVFNEYRSDKQFTITSDIAVLAKGVYFYRVSINEESATLKFIKN